MLRIAFYAGESLLLTAILCILLLPIVNLARNLQVVRSSWSLRHWSYAWLLLFTTNTLCSEWLGPDFTALYHAVIWLSPISLLALLAGRRGQTATNGAIEIADEDLGK